MKSGRAAKWPHASKGISLRLPSLRTDDWIARVHWSPGGDAISAATRGSSFSVWDTKGGKLLFRQKLPAYHTYNAIWSPDGKQIASTSNDGAVRLWTPEGRLIKSVQISKDSANGGEGEDIRGFDWSPDGSQFAIGSGLGASIWDAETATIRKRLKGAIDVITVRWSPDGKYIACNSYSSVMEVWNAATGQVVFRSQAQYGPAVAWSPDSRQVAFPTGNAVNICDPKRGTISNVLEGHIHPVGELAFSYDGRLLASRERSKQSGPLVRRTLIWRTDTWEVVGTIDEKSSWYLYAPLAFSPVDAALATTGREDREVHVWDLTELLKTRAKPARKTTYYKNAKIALLGDSGVGKTGLSLVLAGKQFAPTDSTHGRRICIFENSKVKLARRREEIRELVLWDLAGQPGYRLIHQLHLEDVSLGLILFDAKNELDPFVGIRHWHRALRQAKRRVGLPCKEILVGARIDRGPISVGKSRIDLLLKEMETDRYVETSAKDGSGVAELRELLKCAVDWDSVPTVSSNLLFQRIRRFVLAEKGAGQMLTSINELLRRFSKSRSPSGQNKRELRSSFRTCIDRLQTLGLVRRFSFGDLVLLRPELLDAYASSIIFAAKDEPDGMGSIAEDKVRLGKFKVPDDDRIQNPNEEKLLLLATIEDLIKHEIALREPANEAQLLVFPSQLTRENPDLPDPPGKTLTIAFEGAVLNIYATLVVRLSYSGIFRKHEMWKNAVVFKTGTDITCGFFLTESSEGQGTISIFFSKDASNEVRSQFEDYIYSHILQRALPQSVSKARSITCPDPVCATPVSEIAVRRRQERGYSWIDCNVCGRGISLSESVPTVSVQGVTAQIDRIATAKQARESALVSATGEMRATAFSQWAGSKLSTLALVFTDVVGSTSLGNSLGDEQMGFVRRRHFEQGRNLIKANNGYLIKTIGDSLMVAFRTAMEALDFSLDFKSNPGHKDLQIRAGIHVGPVEIDDEDAFGSMVNYASRVVSAADGAEVWLSDRAMSDIRARKSNTHTELIWHEHTVKLKGYKDEQVLWKLGPPLAARRST